METELQRILEIAVRGIGDVHHQPSQSLGRQHLMPPTVDLRTLDGMPDEALIHLADRRQLFSLVHGFNIPLLELHGVATGFGSDIDKFLGDIQTAIMVDADFRDDETWLPLPYFFVAEI